MPSTIFAIVTLVLLLFAVLWKWIDWERLAINWVGNNPARAQVYTKAGDTIKTCRGERFYIGTEGDMYIYKPDKMNLVAICPRGKNQYPYYYIRGRRIIGVEDGYVVAMPLGFMPEDMIGRYKEGVTDISSIEEGNVMVKAIHSIKSNKVGNWILIGIIVLAVIGGAYVYFNNKNKGESISNNVTTTNITQPAPLENTWEKYIIP
jgi:hypothetical protein